MQSQHRESKVEHATGKDGDGIKPEESGEIEETRMTKLGNMDLPKGDAPMYFCPTCKEWVPEESKHNRKRHDQLKIGRKYRE
jgi:hypothetical protein